MTFGLCYSIFGQEKLVPLKNVVVEANVVDMIAEVTISQTYVNTEDDTIEALYRFPLHESSAVCSFEADIDDKRKVRGVVKESKEASQEYNDAIQKGHGAYLLEQHHPDVFECMVGNITCKQKVVIKITYVTELKHDSETEKIRFVLPTHIAPRYQPTGSGFGSGFGIDPNPLFSTGIGECYNLSISVTCRMTSVITSVESPSHHIVTELNIDGDQKISRVTLEENAKSLERDFVLVVKSQGLDQPRAFTEYNPVTDSNCVMLTLVPKFSINSTITECIFVIDRSGSMDGEPIKKASQALELFVRSLPEDSFFNVISFGSYHSALFPRSQPNSQSSQSAAISHAQQMRADMSGTEIYRCLEWVFGNIRSDMPTAIFLLTDGSVWNVGEIAELVQKNLDSHQDDLRVFTLGIGSSVSHHLVESVARAGKGYSQYVADNERMDKKVISMLKNAVKPPIKDYKITWTNSDLMELEEEIVPMKEKPVISFFSVNVNSPPQPSPDDFVTKLQLRQAPYEIPQIYQGVRLLVYCMLAKGVEPIRTITLSAISQDGPMKLEIPVDPVTLQGSKIHTLAARKLIQDLEDGKSFLHAHPKFEGKHVGISLVKKQIIDLAIKHNITSQYTSFLAIDERDVEIAKDNKTQLPQKRVIPQHFANSPWSQPTISFNRFNSTPGVGFNLFGRQSAYSSIPQSSAFGFNSSASAASGIVNNRQSVNLAYSPAPGNLYTPKSALAYSPAPGNLYTPQSANRPLPTFGGFGSAPINAFGTSAGQPLPTQSLFGSVFRGSFGTSEQESAGQLPSINPPVLGNLSANPTFGGFGSAPINAFGTSEQKSTDQHLASQEKPDRPLPQSLSVLGSASRHSFGTSEQESAGHFPSIDPSALGNLSANRPLPTFINAFGTSEQKSADQHPTSQEKPGRPLPTQSLFGVQKPDYTTFGHGSASINVFGTSEQESADRLFASPENRVYPTNEGAKKSESSTIPDLDLLYKFLRLQSFDGKFLPTEEFYSYFDLGYKNDTDDSLREFGIKHDIDEAVWATSVAIKYLEIVIGEKYQAESELCKEKAERALKRMIGEDEKESTKILEIAQGWINEWSLRAFNVI